MFNIRMGIPEMREYWNDLEKNIKAHAAKKDAYQKVTLSSTDKGNEGNVLMF